ncbi:MAG: Pr6Pr family membrane protein [Gemmatimonadaceae bacterium]|nr:Pr6Pr family membrane protein [Gemmatimonadaceae bacterium]
MSDRAAWSRSWHAVTLLVIAFAIIAQLVLVVQGVGMLADEIGVAAPLGVRLVRFFSYFTVQSNLLAAGAAATLITRPDRDGRTWRVLRVAAIVGMTTTFVVYMIALRPVLHLEGVARLADIGFHYLAPVLTIIGWLLFGPWPRIDTRSLLYQLIGPVGYLVYVLVIGALWGWYPYPFINASLLGYPNALLNSCIVVTAVLGIAAAYQLIDRKLGGAKAMPLR